MSCRWTRSWPGWSTMAITAPRLCASPANTPCAAASSICFRPVAIEPQSEDAARERFKQIADYYEARREALEHPGSGAIYKPLPPDRLYLTEAEWTTRLSEAAVARLTPFAVPEGSGDVFDAGARQSRNFTSERADGSVNLFEA